MTAPPPNDEVTVPFAVPAFHLLSGDATCEDLTCKQTTAQSPCRFNIHALTSLRADRILRRQL